MPDDKSSPNYEAPAASDQTSASSDCKPLHCPDVYCTPNKPYCEVKVTPD